MGARILNGKPFRRVEGRIVCGGVDLDSVAAEHGTPLFVYDGDRIVERYERFHGAFAPVDPLVAYSVKANANLGVLSLLCAAGAGADIVSGGELYRALQAGIPPSKIFFAGVGKTADEIEAALEAGIRAFNVESGDELAALGAIAEARGFVAPFGMRINLDIESPTPHEYTRTGHAGTKFGVASSEALELYQLGRDHPALEPIGIDVHIGSDIHEVDPYLRALDGVLALVERAQDAIKRPLEYVDLGGGYGVAGGARDGIDLDALGRGVASRLSPHDLTLVLEPGRFLVADAGVLITTVLYIKETQTKKFVITDAGMTELIRPSHYGSVHPIRHLNRPPADDKVTVDVVGPVCETGDFLARSRRMVLPEPGDRLAVGLAGAYGSAMASNYNARPRPAEVLVREGEAHLVRARESYQDLVRGETTYEGVAPHPLKSTP